MRTLLLALVFSLPAAAPQGDAALVAEARAAIRRGEPQLALELLLAAEDERALDAAGALEVARAFAALADAEAADSWLVRAARRGAGDARAAALDPLLAPFAARGKLAQGITALAEAHARAALERRVEVRAIRERLDRERALENAAPVRWRDGHGPLPLSSVAVSPDGLRALTVGGDGRVRLWDALGGEPLATLGPFDPGRRPDGEPGEGPGNDADGDRGSLEASFSPDGERVLVLDRRAARASLWDGRGGELIAVLARPDELVLEAAFEPIASAIPAPKTTGGRIALATAEGALLVVDGASARELARARPAATPARRLRWAGGRIVVLGADLALRVLAPTAEGDGLELVLALGGPHEPVLGSALATEPGTGAARAALARADGRVTLVALDGATAPVELAAPGGLGLVPLALDLERLLLGGEDGSLWLARLASAPPELVALAPAGALASPLRAAGANARTAWLLPAPPGTAPRALAVLAGGALGLYDLDAPDTLAVLLGAPPIAIAPDGRRFAATRPDLSLVLGDARTGETVAEPASAGALATALAFSADGDALLAATARGHALVWRLGGGDAGEPLILRGASRGLWGWCLGLAPDGERIVTVATPQAPRDADAGPAHVWSATSGRTLETLEPPAGLALHWARYSPDGRTLAAAARTFEGEPRVCLWSEGKDVRVLAWPAAASERDASAPGIDLVIGLELSRDGGRVLATSWQRGACLWEAADGALVASFPEAAEPPLGWATLAPSGDALAFPGREAGSLFLWMEGRDARPRTLVGHAGEGGWVCELSFVERDGTLELVSADNAGRAFVWNLAEGRPRLALRSPAGSILGLDVDRAGRRLATADADGYARVYALGDGRRVAELGPHPGPVRRVRLAPDGGSLVALCGEPEAWLWRLGEGRASTRLAGHTAVIGNAGFTPDGARIVTVGGDDSLRVWDARRGVLLHTRVELAGGEWLGFAPSGHYVASERGASLARLSTSAGTAPLDCYRAALADPERVRSALAGEVWPVPFLPEPPRVEIVSPAAGGQPVRELELEARFADRYGIVQVEVRLDGEPMPAPAVDSALDFAPGRRVGALRLPLALAPDGRVEIEIAARNERDVWSPPARLTVFDDPPGRELWVLALGVADYDDDTLDLAYPVHDVDALAERLRAEAPGLFRAVHVERLVDGEVSSAALQRSRERFLLAAQPADTILVFAAGHGVRSESGAYYFLTPAATPAEPWEGVGRDLLESLVTWERLAARRRVLLLDTCQSGASFDGKLRGEPVTASFERSDLEGVVGSGLWIVAASSERGFAREQGGHGLFTRALLAGLDGAADREGDRDGLVRIDELVEFVGRAVHEQSAGRQRPNVSRVVGGEPFPLSRAQSAPSGEGNAADQEKK